MNTRSPWAGSTALGRHSEESGAGALRPQGLLPEGGNPRPEEPPPITATWCQRLATERDAAPPAAVVVSVGAARGSTQLSGTFVPPQSTCTSVLVSPPNYTLEQQKIAKWKPCDPKRCSCPSFSNIRRQAANHGPCLEKLPKPSAPSESRLIHKGDRRGPHFYAVR